MLLTIQLSNFSVLISGGELCYIESPLDCLIMASTTDLANYSYDSQLAPACVFGHVRFPHKGGVSHWD